MARPVSKDPYAITVDSDSIPYSRGNALLFLQMRYKLNQLGEGLPGIWRNFENENREGIQKFAIKYLKRMHRRKYK